MHNLYPLNSPGASNRFNQVIEAKCLKVFLCRKYADFKNQTLKQIRWYTTWLYAKEYSRGDPSQNDGNLYPASYLIYLATPDQFIMVAKLFPETF